MLNVIEDQWINGLNVTLLGWGYKDACFELQVSLNVLNVSVINMQMKEHSISVKPKWLNNVINKRVFTDMCSW